MPLNRAQVAIITVAIPRDQRIGDGPWRRSVRLPPQMRAGIGHKALGALRIRDHAQEVLVVGGHVEIEDAGLRREVRVAHPAHALVTLRAIRRDAHVVAADGPQRDVANLVVEFVSALEMACAAQVRVRHLRLDLFRRQFTRIAANFRVAEPVLRETRRIGLGAAALEHVPVRDARRPQVFHVEPPVGIQQFRVAHDDLGPGRAFHLEFHPACQVLPEIDDHRAVVQRREFHRFDRVDDADGRHNLAAHLLRRRFQGYDRFPARVVVTRRVPAGFFEPRIICFAVIQALLDNRPGRPAPGRVGNNLLDLAVRIVDAQLQPPGARALPPAVAEHEARDVVSLLQQVCYVVGHIKGPLVVLLVRRVEHVIAHAFAVQVQLVITQPGHIRPRAADRLRHEERLAHQGRYTPARLRNANTVHHILAAPVAAVEQGRRLDRTALREVVALRVEHFHFGQREEALSRAIVAHLPHVNAHIPRGSWSTLEFHWCLAGIWLVLRCLVRDRLGLCPARFRRQRDRIAHRKSVAGQVLCFRFHAGGV